ncbi:MAG: hypothetical protein LH628_00155 [Microcoleus sp. CAN_BIN18]|nr:hypothetical protein [Microcoleus sp. CAN_BIN18]
MEFARQTNETCLRRLKKYTEDRANGIRVYTNETCLRRLKIRPWLRFPANGIRVYTNTHAPVRVEDSPVVEIPGEWNSRLHKRNPLQAG